MCRNCGAIVGAGQASCGVCGAPSTALPGAADVEAPASLRAARSPETLRFVRAVVTRPATFTFVFLVANIFVFLLMSLAGGSENGEVLRAYGAKYNSLIDQGQWWRFVTPVFMHIGFLHIFVNMYSLFALGPYVEKLYGSAKFVFFWVLTGVAGVAASYLASNYEMHEGFLGRFLFRGGDGPSAGASGALFGLVGVLFVFGIKFRHELPEEFKRAFGFGMLPTILVNLFIGFTVPFIDNAAHLGGFVAGAVLALFVGYKRPGARGGADYAWHVLQFAALALVVTSFVMVRLNFSGPAPSLQNASAPNLLPGARGQSFIEYARAVGAGEEAFVKAFNEGDAGGIDRAAETLDRAPQLEEEAGRLRDELKTLLARVKTLAEAGGAQQQQRLRRRERSELIKDFTSWQERSARWLSANSEKYGVEVREQPRERREQTAPSPESK